MRNNIDEVIKTLAKSCKKNFSDFEGIYLLGCFLDGKEHPDGDIELVALFDSEDKSKRESIWALVGAVEEEFDVYIDLTPTTSKDLAEDEELAEEIKTYGRFFDSQGKEITR